MRVLIDTFDPVEQVLGRAIHLPKMTSVGRGDANGSRSPGPMTMHRATSGLQPRRMPSCRSWSSGARFRAARWFGGLPRTSPRFRGND